MVLRPLGMEKAMDLPSSGGMSKDWKHHCAEISVEEYDIL